MADDDYQKEPADAKKKGKTQIGQAENEAAALSCVFFFPHSLMFLCDWADISVQQIAALTSLTQYGNFRSGAILLIAIDETEKEAFLH